MADVGKPAQHSLLLRQDARLVVVADTHGRPHPQCIERISALRPCRILHAGDVGSSRVLDDLSQIAAVLAVRGNIDPPAPLPDALTLEISDGQRTSFRLLLLHIAVHGTKLRRNVVELARAERASLVVCGHSHVPFIGRDAGLTVFNPGSIGPRRFRLPCVFGVIEIRAGNVGLSHVECETGRKWVPGPDGC